MNAIRWDSLASSYYPIFVYYILSLTIIIVLAIKSVGFSKVRQTISNIFAMHYGDIKDWISIFYLDFLLYKAKKHYFMVEEVTRRTQNTELISYFKYA